MNTPFKSQSLKQTEKNLKVIQLNQPSQVSAMTLLDERSHSALDSIGLENQVRSDSVRPFDEDDAYYIKIQTTLYLRKTADLSHEQNSHSLPKNLSINPFSSQIIREGFPPIKLTRIELNLATFLYQAFGFSIHRRDLIQMIWAQDEQSSQSFDVHLCNLRKKLRSIELMIHFHPPGLYSLEDTHQEAKHSKTENPQEICSTFSILN